MQQHAHPGQPAPAESFPTDPTGLPEATRPELLELADGDAFHLRVGPVAKRLAGTTVRMLGYNGSIPRPVLKVGQGSEVVVHVTNDGDLDATVHWHGLRLDNKYDGVPQEPRPRSRSAASSPTGSGPPTRACTGTTPTSARTTPRRWAWTATSWSSPPTRITGRPPTAMCC